MICLTYEVSGVLPSPQNVLPATPLDHSVKLSGLSQCARQEEEASATNGSQKLELTGTLLRSGRIQFQPWAGSPAPESCSSDSQRSSEIP